MILFSEIGLTVADKLWTAAGILATAILTALAARMNLARAPRVDLMDQRTLDLQRQVNELRETNISQQREIDDCKRDRTELRGENLRLFQRLAELEKR